MVIGSSADLICNCMKFALTTLSHAGQVARGDGQRKVARVRTEGKDQKKEYPPSVESTLAQESLPPRTSSTSFLFKCVLIDMR